MSVETTFDDTVEFEIRNIVPDEDAKAIPFDSLTFEYTRPAISVDTKARFVTHEIIGGTTVRQKIGDEPIEASISGVCIESTAKRLPTLRQAKRATIIAPQLPGESLTAQIASASTSPMNDGGAGRLEDGEVLYNYSLKIIEV